MNMDNLDNRLDKLEEGYGKIIKLLEGKEKKKKKITFKVPKEHPIFDGNPKNLELFVREMEFTHSEFTSGENAREDTTEFIKKLVPYFKTDSGVCAWFKMYASNRHQAGKKMSWKKLVRDLREQYGEHDHHRARFEDFYDMAQVDDINTYITKKKEAALLAPEVTPRIHLFGFMRGLRDNIRSYVDLQRPDTVEEAEQWAKAFERSLTKKRKLAPIALEDIRDKETLTKKAKKLHPEKKVDKNKRSSEQENALQELRAIKHRGVCFACGNKGHRAGECNASSETQATFSDKVNKLKSILNK